MEQEKVASNATISSMVLPLPSKGKIYSVGSSLYHKEEIEVREMTTNEEDILTSISLIKTGKAIDNVIENCILDKNIDSSKLVVGDRNAIIIGMVLASYGADYKVDVPCEKCGEINTKYQFNLNNLPVKFLTTEPLEDGKNEFNFILPKSKLKITFSLPTAEDEKEISTTVQRLKNAVNTGKESNVSIRLKKIIKSIDNNYDTRKIAEFIDQKKMSIMDSTAIRNYVEEISPDITTAQPFKCMHCGFESEVKMPINFDFFWRTK